MTDRSFASIADRTSKPRRACYCVRFATSLSSTTRDLERKAVSANSPLQFSLYPNFGFIEQVGKIGTAGRAPEPAVWIFHHYLSQSPATVRRPFHVWDQGCRCVDACGYLNDACQKLERHQPIVRTLVSRELHADSRAGNKMQCSMYLHKRNHDVKSSLKGTHIKVHAI